MNIKQSLITLVLAGLVSACASQTPFTSNQAKATTQTSSQQLLEQVIDDEWRFRHLTNAKDAHKNKLDYQGPYLGSVTPAFYQRRLQGYRQLLERLQRVDQSQLNESDSVSYQLLQRQLELNIGDIELQAYQLPFTSETGFHTKLDFALRHIELSNDEAIQNYLLHLQDLPRYYAEHIANMRSGLARGFTMPQVIMPSVIAPLKRHLVEKAEQSPLWEPVAQLKARATPESDNQVQKFRQVIEGQVLPAYRELYAFFKDEYTPKALASIAASDRDQGLAFYAHEVKKYTTLDLTPEAIHQIGLGEVKRIRAEMQEVIDSLKFKGSFQDFIHFLRTDKQFYAPTPEQLLKEAAYIAKKADGVMPKYFGRLPRQPYTVKPVPASIAPNYTTGRYSGASLESGRAGEYWVNTYALDKRPLYVLEALTLHEAVPGHHLSSALTLELDGLPKFRQHDYISAFGEGWALYAEYLGVEAGFYQDPYSQFGRLTYEMWRAIRLVVDTGMHAMGWTRQQSIDFMKNNTALSLHNVRTEIDRYISWPGQALSYKLGELKIKELRAMAEQELGDDFDLRGFHDEILGYGSVSLATLESIINKWVAQQKQKLQSEY